MSYMADEEGFTAEQVAAATGTLRAALGLPAERFGTEAFVGMISDEIEALRAAGKTDGDIAGILAKSTGMKIGAEAITEFFAGPDERGR